MSPVPRDVMAAEVRAVIERHDEWDMPHEFVTLRWDGKRLIPGTVGVIMPDINPGQYPKLMASLAAKHLSDHPDRDLPCAYLLKIEGFGVAEPPPSATDEERRQFNADRIGRAFYQRPDAIEFVQAWCADIHGRLWSATGQRARPGDIQVKFYRPGDTTVRGQLVKALLSIAAATGALMAGANLRGAGMHLRNASCRGARYGTDLAADHHGPHEFFPHSWAEAIPCPGWTVQEDAARKLTDLLLDRAEHDLEPDGASLQCGWQVSLAISRLLTPDYPGEDDAGISHQITRLFGVPIAIVAGDGRWWRLNAGRHIDGGDVIAEGVMADG